MVRGIRTPPPNLDQIKLKTCPNQTPDTLLFPCSPTMMSASAFSGSRITILHASSGKRAAITSRRSVVAPIQANTLWSLAPRQTKAQFFESVRSAINLTGVLGKHKLCSVAAKDYAEKANEAIDLTVVDHGGLHLLFEAEGAANPVDSPSVLYVTDFSECDVVVDNVVLKKGQKTKLHPGATIDMGEEASYVVLRNVLAHA